MSENRENIETWEINNNVETQMQKCPGCGANLVFDPERQALYCAHCGTVESLPESLTAKELDINSAFSSDRNWSEEEASAFECDNCGAKVVLQKGETATSCPFCGTAHVMKTNELLGLKPNALIPFAFGRDKAVELAKQWAKKRLYAPRKFKKNITTDNLKGVYTPCFTFDSSTLSYYKGRIGKRHTRTVGSGKNRRTETYIVWRNIAGTYADFFDDVLVSAGQKMDQKKLDKINPFDTNNSKEYEEKYLLGFMAYHYDCELESCWDTAKNRIDVALRNSILAQYSYDVVDYLNVSTTHSNVTYKYVMLPVYVGNYKYNKKTYNFYINGETGKVTGKYPISPLKVIFTVLGGLALIAIIAAIIYFYGS